MAMIKCRECGKSASDQAETCPHCGISKPAPPPRSKDAGPLGIAVALVFGLIVFSCTLKQETAPATAPTAAAPMKSLETVRREMQDAENERLAKMTPKETIEYLKPKLLEVCERHGRLYNHIRVEQRGKALYCVHDFYSQYSLSIGPLGPAMVEFINEHRAQIVQAKLNRIGVYGRGEYASGQWYQVD